MVLLREYSLFLLKFDVVTDIQIVCRQKVVFVFGGRALQIGQETSISILSSIQHGILILQVTFFRSFQLLLVC